MNPELLAWINQQHAWLRVAAERLVRTGEISDADITDFVEILKNPPQAHIENQPDEAGVRRVVNVADLRLLSLGPVEGIDALNPRSPLSFGDGNLSVVYGNNGAGKSGYTRIISKAFGKSHAGDLRGNVFEPAAERQMCHIKYSIDGAEVEIDWTPPTSVDELALIDIFDSTSGRIYLESETEAAYMPPELAMLGDLVNACGRVEAVLTAEERLLVSRLPAINPNYEGTMAAVGYGGIQHDWTEEKVAALVEWNEQLYNQLELLNSHLAVADPLAAADKLRGVKRQREGLANMIEQAVSQLAVEGFERSRSLFEEAIDKRRIAREAAEALRSVSTIEGVGSDTWRAMWNAARDFSTTEAYPGIPFPSTGLGARCVFCQQDLDELARERLTSFEDYISSQIENDAAAAEKALYDHLNGIVTRPTPENLQTAAQAAELDQGSSDLLEEVWGELESSLRPLSEGIRPESPVEPSQGLLDLIESLRRLATEAEEQAVEISKSADPEVTRSAETRKNELLAKKWVSEQAVAIREEVRRLKQVHDYQQWKRQTVTTGLSRKANELSQTLVTDAYVERFTSELRQLGANEISVELVKTGAERGRVRHSLRLRNAVVDGARVSEILSEGERRIISLAAFLADVTGRNTPSPFIFDDPISSLDQTWEEKTIDRLIRLSQDRQVIVFTHRLSLLGIISEKAGDGLATVHIRREPWGTGQPGDVPLFGKRPDRALTALKPTTHWVSRSVAT
jgi:energy-coupling factor transporter ATP-binding protein EcfA2